MTEELTPRLFRSRLNELPLDLRTRLAEIPYQKGMSASHREEKVIDILNEYKDISYLKIGTGTNRIIIRYKGYAIKTALDFEGVADNKQEWAMAEELYPHVSYSHDISSGGNFLVEDYAPAFTSFVEMAQYRTTIMKILSNWSKKYLLGDVGFSKINYANWGLLNGRPVCIDYAYIFPASMDLFRCICGSKSISPSSDFTSYKCDRCGKTYQDRDIRAKISQQERLRLFNRVDGIVLREPSEVHMVSSKYNKIDTNPDLPNPYETAINVAKANGFSFDNM